MRVINRKSQGFTLIEVMIALVVITMISFTIWSATSQSARTRTAVSQIQDRMHEIRVAFDYLNNDLSSAFLSNHRPENEPTHDPVFIGADHGDDDRLDFAAFTHHRRYLDADESDQCEVGYYLAQDKDDSEKMNLVRRESPHLDLEPTEGGRHMIIIRDVASFELQYFDLPMNEWQDEWDTTQFTEEAGYLPHFVRIKIVVNEPRGNRIDEVAYATQIQIPMRTAIWRKYGFIPGPSPAVTP